jgi:hypothetical protein
MHCCNFNLTLKPKPNDYFIFSGYLAAYLVP